MFKPPPLGPPYFPLTRRLAGRDILEHPLSGRNPPRKRKNLLSSNPNMFPIRTSQMGQMQGFALARAAKADACAHLPGTFAGEARVISVARNLGSTNDLI